MDVNIFQFQLNLLQPFSMLFIWDRILPQFIPEFFIIIIIISSSSSIIIIIITTKQSLE